MTKPPPTALVNILHEGHVGLGSITQYRESFDLCFQLGFEELSKTGMEQLKTALLTCNGQCAAVAAALSGDFPGMVLDQDRPVKIYTIHQSVLEGFCGNMCTNQTCALHPENTVEDEA